MSDPRVELARHNADCVTEIAVAVLPRVLDLNMTLDQQLCTIDAVIQHVSDSLKKHCWPA